MKKGKLVIIIIYIRNKLPENYPKRINKTIKAFDINRYKDFFGAPGG